MIRLGFWVGISGSLSATGLWDILFILILKQCTRFKFARHIAKKHLHMENQKDAPGGEGLKLVQ